VCFAQRLVVLCSAPCGALLSALWCFAQRLVVLCSAPCGALPSASVLCSAPCGALLSALWYTSDATAFAGHTRAILQTCLLYKNTHAI